MCWFRKTALQFLANRYVIHYNKNMWNKIFNCLLTIFIIFFLVGWLGNWKRAMKTGTEAYWNQDYDAAVEAFQQATFDKPDNPIALHNLGTALYKKGRYKDAVAAFQRSLLKGNVPSEATVYYNLGNAQFQLHDLSAAIESYKSSLRLNPHDADAKYNLALALQLLKEQQENAAQQKMDSKPKQNLLKNEPSNIPKAKALQLLERLSKNENKRRQKILKQQLNSGYRRDKDW
jgi:Ca-activated chloride channel family protein